ncbi:MAG: ribose 5-phosphate isomerase B [Raineya sp.]|jgi:ribose 5-phosphate isomerase B|nr:ribose 5-phosphate isomerase B [Raineya sp.]
MKIAIGSDHAGFEYKELIKKFLFSKNIEFTDFGTHSSDSVDYPDFAHPVANSVESQDSNFGILVCGSGNGVAITANKHKDIRAALCWTTELAELARQHNDANVLCLPARFVSIETAQDMVNAFLNTAFEGGRHSNRVSKITAGC